MRSHCWRPNHASSAASLCAPGWVS
jgi:hypothetical protein